jgi:hypothetical protein
VTAVVSDRACSGFDHFVVQAAKNSLAKSGTEFVAIPDDDAVAPEPDVVMFTVSSYMFRVLFFMHFGKNLNTRSYFATLANASDDEMVGERFLDTVVEYGNLFCGALNRDLAHFFPHLGMSTPCILTRSSVDHIAEVHPAFTRRYRVETTSAVDLHFTLAVCPFVDLDFAFEPSAVQEEEVSGELEMF